MDRRACFLHRVPPMRAFALSLALAPLSVGCLAQIGDTRETVAPDAGSGVDGGGPVACTTRGVGPTPIRRLTRFEYDHTVRELLGDTSSAAAAFLPDAVAFGFDNNAVAQSVSAALVEQHLHAAESLARAITDDTPRLRAWLPCEPNAQPSCGPQFVEHFLTRAFRRPPRDDERQSYERLYEAGATQGFRTGIRWVIAAALLSPNFWYRIELSEAPPDSAGLVALDDWALASRLSYLVWGSMPDDTLFDRARRGELRDPSVLVVELRRLLADPRAHAGLGHFAEQWLELEGLPHQVKDPAIYPEATPEVRAAMLQASLHFFEEVLRSGTMQDLYTSPRAYLNESTAPLVGAAVSGPGLRWVELPAGERSGILTDLAVLSAHAKTNQTSPVLRGRFVREQLLCQPLMSPPDNVNTTPPEIKPGATTRERFDQHRADPACAGCHQMMDPIGFGFEAYDGIGRRRSLDNGLPVDDRGEIIGFTGGNRSFTGALELGQILATSEQAQLCLSQQWFRYGLGRVECPEDRCGLQGMGAHLRAEGGRLRSVLEALVQSDAFRFRRPITTAPECGP
jgi:hypothetical protein